MDIQFYTPYKLKGLVHTIWEHTSSTAQSWTILPSGKIELMFRIGSPPDLTGAKKISAEENPMREFAFMSGLQTRPLSMSLNSMHFIGVQMTPVAFKAFFGLPLSLITDYYLAGSELLQTLSKIEDRLNEEGTFHQKARWLEDLLYAKILETPELHMAMTLSAMTEKLLKTKPDPNRSIEKLTGYSRTHTFRLFNEWFGTTPHAYLRLQQFVNSINFMHRFGDNLTATGLQNGYFDQAHFIRSFKSFSGITPGEYRRRMTHVPGQISG